MKTFKNLKTNAKNVKTCPRFVQEVTFCDLLLGDLHVFEVEKLTVHRPICCYTQSSNLRIRAALIRISYHAVAREPA